jgi:hypothetical protein
MEKYVRTRDRSGESQRCDDIECAADFVAREVEEKAEKNQFPFLARLKDGLGSYPDSKVWRLIKREVNR